MLLTILLSYIAGLLTALAPCVLPLLPIILGGSLNTQDKNKRRPYIIIASLVVSLILFTILLKVSTVFIGINPKVWAIGSGLLIVGLGLFMLFPDAWARVIAKTGIEHRSQGLLGKAFQNKNGTVSAILTGAALGPVFSSCSPTYAWVIATVLPANTFQGVLYLAVYCLGVATSLLAIALLGQRLLQRIKWASDPKGWFQRGIAIVFILVGLFIATGWDKKVQTYLVEKDFINIKLLEEQIVPESSSNQNDSSDIKGEKFNINPYQAPEFKKIEYWINSQPLTIADLKGKVVLVDFWTYSCINCQRTQPYLNAWQSKYSNDGLIIVSMHAPEFSFEKVPKNVEQAVNDAKIKYPVALDNAFATWNAYNNRFWPAKYLIDKNGFVRYTHFGEGKYQETEEIIQKLLAESGKSVKQQLESEPSISTDSNQTPETYLGYERGERFANANEFKGDTAVNYSLSNALDKNNWTLGGKWQISNESSQSLENSAKLAINFTGGEVYLVMSGPPGAKLSVNLENLDIIKGSDVSSTSEVTIDKARLYKLVDSKDFLQEKKLTLTVPVGVTINAFTFGR